MFLLKKNSSADNMYLLHSTILDFNRILTNEHTDLKPDVCDLLINIGSEYPGVLTYT